MCGGLERLVRQAAKCDAGSFVGTSSISLASAQARKRIHSAAPPHKIAIALLDCDFVTVKPPRTWTGMRQ